MKDREPNRDGEKADTVEQTSKLYAWHPDEAVARLGEAWDEDSVIAPLLTARELADILNVPYKRVYELPIPEVRLGERTLRWRPEDVEAFIESRRVAA